MLYQLPAWTPDPLDGGPPAGVLEALRSFYEADMERIAAAAAERKRLDLARKLKEMTG